MVVTVPWENQNGNWWNETCAIVVEHFGLPGNKYVSHPTEECMKFIFYNDLDALMCKILISDRL